MQDLRDELNKNSHYLGATGVREEVVWRRMGRENTLVTSESAMAEAARMAEIAAAKLKEGNEGHDSGDDEPDESESRLVPAPLTLVALLSSDNCWLAPDGFWKGPTAYTPTLADFKMNCQLAAPNLSPFTDDFTRVMRNVQWLMTSIETEGNEKQGILDPKEKPFATIKLRHVLFEVRLIFTSIFIHR